MGDAVALPAPKRFLEESQENLLLYTEKNAPRFEPSQREALSHQYDLGSREPNIQVWNVNLRGDRSLTLRHFQHNERPLNDGGQEVLKHVARLWGFGVQLESINAKGDTTQRWSVPAPAIG